MNMSKEIAKKLLEIKAVTIKDTSNLFTWASGIKSPIYCDNRLTMSYPEVRDKIAEGFKEVIEKEFPEVGIIAGTATAGIPHAAWVSQKMNLPMVYVRSSAKGHGKQNQVEGRLFEGKKVVLIEDLLSTGGSSMKAVKALKEAGANVIGVVAIFSYNFKKADDLFKQEGVEYRTLTNYDILLPLAAKMGYVKEEELQLLKQWSKDPYIFTK
ncbi:orotate phosphoribosyltransferase [Paramaledivibacter caminithermalis]|uniref:Orotate phosphoribosyltransferase n=1 Tax=Paramaledivibacter caminithermalis (strain DSM 15212 / CIP 107654 / DViRD3) TaxID=1121301 RepID=A0A1M6LP22_PARC5|nr:orotate phosphoribosyltransferase [Paramaledivibacter caminithermalis]SHJ72920.1 orotate phosphoribosyltransferase [Paramaledivibacter caminithermalis DSM 15212]